MNKHIIILLSLLAFFSQTNAQRLFQKHSTWYEKIPENPKITPNSKNYVNDIIINGSVLAINYRDWSVPIWFAKSNTPYQIVDTPGDSRPAKYGWNNVPIPPEAQSAGKQDGHLVIISHDRKYEWDFYQAKKKSDGTWIARHLRRWDLTTDGINSPYDGKGTCRAAPVPLTAGLITYEEIQKGYIDHALAFAYWGNKVPDENTDFPDGVYPCVKPNSGLSKRKWAMSFGFRLRLDPALDIDSLGLNRAARIIARALQEYGMIFVENCGPGCNSVYAESLGAKDESWQGIFDASITKIPLSKFQVVDPIYPDFSEEFKIRINPSVFRGYAPLQVQFSTTVSNGAPPYTFFWNFGDGNTSNEPNPSHTFISAGNYHISLTVQDNNGFETKDSLILQVTDPALKLSIKDIKFTEVGKTQQLDSLNIETWYDLYVYFNTPPIEWSQIAYADVWLNRPSYTAGSIENRGGKHFPSSSYILSYSISSISIWARQKRDSFQWSKINGNLGSYVDDHNNEYDLNENEGWAKAKIKLLNEAETGVWRINAYVQAVDKSVSTLYSKEIIVNSQSMAPTASIRLGHPSPVGIGSLSITLATSKNVTVMPTPLILIESDSTSTYIGLKGVTPGNNFTGILNIDDTIAEGTGYFSLYEHALMDENGNKGNKIISGNHIKIDKTKPSPPQNVSVHLINQ